MLRTTVVFVHGFISNSSCWDPFLKRLQQDKDFVGNGYQFIRFDYSTKFVEWNLTKRIPKIAECASLLDEFLRNQPKYDQLFLVGHSMGGLIIQSYLAQKIQAQRGVDLAKIRSVILFATPNRGSTIASGAREIISWLRDNPQEKELRVLDEDVADTSDVIVRSVLGAKSVDQTSCPIPFRAFWGLDDKIVPKVSARGPFVEASALPGGHSEILQCDPVESSDQRYPALKSALLNPIGHPSIYEIEQFDVNLSVSPLPSGTTCVLTGDVKPLSIQTDNVAIRTSKIKLSEQNRCTIPYEQFYRSDEGLVELLSLTQPNDAADEIKSEYHDTGRKFSYVYTPKLQAETFSLKLRIFNGFGKGERSWHNHMNVNARYKMFRLTLDLQAYRDAGYRLSQGPNMFYYPQNIMDHALCANRVGETPLPYLASPDPWLRTWTIPDVKGGVVDLVWDVDQPA